MYKGKKIVTALLAGIIAFGFLTGCQDIAIPDDMSRKAGEYLNDTVEMTKNAIKDEIKDLLASADFASGFGITQEEQESIRNDIKGYIKNYDADEEQLRLAKENVEKFLENARGLSSEEIKKGIADIFEAQEQ